MQTIIITLNNGKKEEYVKGIKENLFLQVLHHFLKKKEKMPY